MDISSFLAKLIGIYMLVFAVVWLIHKKRVNTSLKDFISSKATIILTGFINTITGLAIAIGHPVWQPDWRVLITLFGYLLIATGIMRFVYTDKVQKDGMSMLTKGFWPIIAVLTVLGAFLTYSGFMAS